MKQLFAAMTIAVMTLADGVVSSAAGSGHARAAADKQPHAVSVWATYYGWYDNTPPGCATAYSGCAKGTGTYADPITFASDKQEFPVGTILYYPTIEKYVVMGDDCQECDLEWTGKGPSGGPHFHHLDIWTGGKGGNQFAAINCEDALTQGLPNGAPLSTPFIQNPPRDLPVSTEPLFNAKTGHCYGGATTSATHGRYKNAAAGKCLADAGNSRKKGSLAVLATCGAGKGEDVTFEGAFFVVNGLCLQTKGGKPGSRLGWAACTGGPHEQWSVNPDGTITWIQYTFCVADVSERVEMTTCTGKAPQKWSFIPGRA
jgi:hypothetical protein